MKYFKRRQTGSSRYFLYDLCDLFHISEDAHFILIMIIYQRFAYIYISIVSSFAQTEKLDLCHFENMYLCDYLSNGLKEDRKKSNLYLHKYIAARDISSHMKCIIRYNELILVHYFYLHKTENDLKYNKVIS